jgi:hypothetical protein
MPKPRNLQHLRTNLTNKIQSLSRDLYSEETHFLLELLQNADDSHYPVSVRAKVCINFVDDTFEFRTNEEGFHEKDVDSLCDLGCSTKLGNHDTIGEKGIGFKSVFKVATTATIRSGPYSFKLDTNPPLDDFGMIVPTWVEPPTDTASANTTGTHLTLRLKPDVDRKALLSELKEFDFAFLLFTRRVKQMEIAYRESAGRSIVKEIKHEQLSSFQGRAVSIMSRVGYQSWHCTKYIRYEYKFGNMPTEAKRSGLNESTVVFAFPYLNDLPYIRDQKLFAFLPVGHFGFQVCLAFTERANITLTD